MSSKQNQTSATESKIAASQTDTGAPNDERAAATQVHGSAPATRVGTVPPPAGHTAPDGQSYVGAGTAQTWDGRREGAEHPLGGEQNEPAPLRSALVATTPQGNDHSEGKKTHDETPTVDSAELLAHTAPGTPLAAQRSHAAPVVHAPTVTPKGKLGYMATPAVPEGGVAPGVTASGPQKADYFTKPIVETAITKSGSAEDKRETSER